VQFAPIENEQRVAQRIRSLRAGADRALKGFESAGGGPSGLHSCGLGASATLNFVLNLPPRNIASTRYVSRRQVVNEFEVPRGSPSPARPARLAQPSPAGSPSPARPAEPRWAPPPLGPPSPAPAGHSCEPEALTPRRGSRWRPTRSREPGVRIARRADRASGRGCPQPSRSRGSAARRVPHSR